MRQEILGLLLLRLSSAIPNSLQKGFEPLYPQLSWARPGIISTPDGFCSYLFSHWELYLEQLQTPILWPLQATDVYKIDKYTIRHSCRDVRSAGERVQQIVERQAYYQSIWFSTERWLPESDVVGWWDVVCPTRKTVVETVRTNRQGEEEPYAYCLTMEEEREILATDVHLHDRFQDRTAREHWEADPANRWPQYVRFSDTKSTSSNGT